MNFYFTKNIFIRKFTNVNHEWKFLSENNVLIPLCSKFMIKSFEWKALEKLYEETKKKWLITNGKRNPTKEIM